MELTYATAASYMPRATIQNKQTELIYPPAALILNELMGLIYYSTSALPNAMNFAPHLGHSNI